MGEPHHSYHLPECAVLSLSSCSSVHIVTTSESLRRRDAQEFADYWTLAGMEKRDQYHSHLNFAKAADAVIIVVEAD